MLPLEGIRVLDFTQVVAGPYCGMLLADMGADTIKIERPGIGDHARLVGAYSDNHYGAYFFQFNRNKKSLTLDLRKGRAKEILMKLAKDSDVFVENYSPGVVNKLGISYDDLEKVNPRLVYCSISGFGKTGANANIKRGAYNIVAMGEAGLLSDYEASTLQLTDPTKPIVAFVDLATGIYAAYAITLALLDREKSGTGRYIDINMLDVALSLREDMALYDTGTIVRYITDGPDRPFRTQDRWVTISITTDEQWKNLCDVLGTNELLVDPRFSTLDERSKLKNYQALIKIIEPAVLKWQSKDLVEKLTEAQVPCGLVNNLGDIFEEELTKKRILEMNHPLAGKKIRVPATPIFMSGTTAKPQSPAPLIGHNNDEILKQLGYTESQIKELEQEGAI